MRGKQDIFYRGILDKILFVLFHLIENRHFRHVRFSERLTSVENSQPRSSKFPPGYF